MWQRNEQWIGSHVEDSFVMINIESGKYIALNATGAAVWDFIAEARTEQSIVDHLLREFDVEAETCRRSVQTLMKRLRQDELARPID